MVSVRGSRFCARLDTKEEFWPVARGFMGNTGGSVVEVHHTCLPIVVSAYVILTKWPGASCINGEYIFRGWRRYFSLLMARCPDSAVVRRSRLKV